MGDGPVFLEDLPPSTRKAIATVTSPGRKRVSDTCPYNVPLPIMVALYITYVTGALAR